MKRREVLLRGAAGAAAILTGFTLAGCSEKKEAPAQGASGATKAEAQRGSAKATESLAVIRERGKLVIAIEGTWSPWTYHDQQGVLTGYDVAVGRLPGGNQRNRLAVQRLQEEHKRMRQRFRKRSPRLFSVNVPLRNLNVKFAVENTGATFGSADFEAHRVIGVHPATGKDTGGPAGELQ